MTCIVAIEPFAAAWPEAEALAKAHFEEVEGPLAAVRPFKLNTAVLEILDRQGSFKVVTARTKGRLVGYLTWTIQRDVESCDLLVAQQGAWYVAPGNAGAGRKLADHSIEYLREIGVGGIYFHHRLLGRGAALGAFFTRLGATEIKREFYLPVKAIS